MTDSPTNEGDITPSESTPPHPPKQQSPTRPQEAPAVKPSNGWVPLPEF